MKSMATNQEAFRNYYRQLTDDELARILADRKYLVPEAAEALDLEVQRRDFVIPQPPQWTRHPGSEERVTCLEDYKEYRSLLKRKKTFRRYWYIAAIGPFVIGLVLGRKFFQNSIFLITITLAWAVCVAVYGMILDGRLWGFTCPQCAKGFGRRGECFQCGFPRRATKYSTE